jgi:hypothetical protein
LWNSIVRRQIRLQLPIDECEEWIWDTLDSTKDCSFEYIKGIDKEFLIFRTNDCFVDAKALEKIKTTTGMLLVQMSTHKGYTQLWFGRPVLSKNNNNNVNLDSFKLI